MKKRERQQSDDWDFEGEEGELVRRSQRESLRLDWVSACFRLAFGALMVVYAVHMAPINPKRQVSSSGAAVRHATGRLKFKGCYRLESQFPKRKIYGGGKFGANIDEAIRMAKHEKRRYVAIARIGSEGHAFTFDEAPTGPKLDYTDPGCNRKCKDDTLFVCGCADADCDGLERQADEEHLRRFVVYDLYAETETEKKKKLAQEKSAEEEKKKFLKWASGSPAGEEKSAEEEKKKKKVLKWASGSPAGGAQAQAPGEL